MDRVQHHKVRAMGAIADLMLGQLQDHPYARKLQAEAARLQHGAAALDRVNANRNPLETPEAHVVKVAKLAKKFDREITASINRAGDIFRDGIADTHRRIESKIDLNPSRFEAEIREVFRGLTSEEKSDLIKELVEQNRGPELAAIVKAPTALTGLTEDRRAKYEEMILARHASEELQELEELEGVHHAFVRAQNLAVSFASDFTDPKSIAEIQRGEASAIAASEAFENSMQ